MRPYLLALLITLPVTVLAQAPPPLLNPLQLDRLVERVALYPDPLLAQSLAAATYPDQIPDADMWANQHRYIKGNDLAAAIDADRLPWDPSVQSLLPFPDVLHMMNADMGWTSELGDAVLSQRNDVMDAVQREREKAYRYGYLRTSQYASVVYAPGRIVIDPVNPALIYVPAYDPVVVYAPPRPGLFVGGVIHFGAGFSIGAAFAPWGWGGVHFGWGEHAVIINNRPWVRTYATRRTYVHPYSEPRYQPGRRVEDHRLEEHHDDVRGRGRDDHRGNDHRNDRKGDRGDR